jgi:hypothetical protein
MQKGIAGIPRSPLYKGSLRASVARCWGLDQVQLVGPAAAQLQF